MYTHISSLEVSLASVATALCFSKIARPNHLPPCWIPLDQAELAFKDHEVVKRGITMLPHLAELASPSHGCRVAHTAPDGECGWTSTAFDLAIDGDDLVVP